MLWYGHLANPLPPAMSTWFVDAPFLSPTWMYVVNSDAKMSKITSFYIKEGQWIKPDRRGLKKQFLWKSLRRMSYTEGPFSKFYASFYLQQMSESI